MKCNKCSNQAFLRVDDSTVLCADCWNQITERLKDDFNSTLDPATGVDAAAAPDLTDPPVAAVVKIPNASVFNPPDVATGAPVFQPRSPEPPVAPFPDMPACLIRKNATTFRVAAASSIQDV